MHTTHNNSDVDSTIRHQSGPLKGTAHSNNVILNLKSGVAPAQTQQRLRGLPLSDSNGSALPLPSSHQNGGTAATATVTATATANAAASSTATPPNGYQNAMRRDSSTQVWTPLLANGNTSSNSNSGNANGIAGGNGSSHSNGIGIGGDGATVGNGVNGSVTLNGGVPEPTTVLYGPASNNNEWKGAEEINNLKNGLLHHHPHAHAHAHVHANAHAHTHPNGHGRNNNGSLINGKNGLGNFAGLADKYDEQDPLTGLYKQKHARPSESDESDFDSDVSGGDQKTPTCGLFGCRPKWARSFASTHVFMVVFLLAYILQGMYMTYFVSVITTIEKLFQIKSKTTGFLLSASEMGQISTAMLLTYFAGRGHRPRWIACGMVLFSIAAFACSLPHFIFGKQLLQSSALLQSSRGLLQAPPPPASAYAVDYALDMPMTTTGNNYTQHNETTTMATMMYGGRDFNLCQASDNASGWGDASECNEDRRLEQVSHSKITVIVLCIFFGSLLSSGIGQTAVATLGIPYIDDNVASKQSPMYMAITIGVRILGPASGFIVGSFCTRWYVNFTNPGFDASDPRWIGAWWLGPVVIGTLMMLSSIAMFSFPKQLRGKKTSNPPENSTEIAGAELEEKPKLKDFPKTVRRQLNNDILMFRTASCVFHLLPIAGLYTFLPKYLETQFRLATYDANMIAAFCGILVMGVGIVISGLVILKLKPSAKSVAAWIAFTALFYSAGMVILMFVGCSMNDFAGYKSGTSDSPALIEPACSAALDCTCDKENFAPICGIDGKIYISACHAGCMETELREGDNRTVFSNCACIPEFPDNHLPYKAVSGYCDSNCRNFIFFILIFAICVFMHSTCEVGSMLLVMRCTHPKDKAMAMGVIQSAIGLFGNVPCPIIYGAVVDSACLIWKSVCGKHGACSLYDADTFRHYFLGITAGIMFLAFIMDLVVWSKAHRIDIAPEDNNDNKSTETECKKSMAAPDTSV